ncbi:DUF1780 domain-containing protein [Methylobacter svalbardensis]|uniref:DUF1780 domain-containing protein n=1 Tax=Methylobacter svalbardensis TaxID=3080016 RepID=UPI0030EE3712
MDEYVKSVKEGLKESVSFFGNKNKQNREVWVLKEFLKYLPVDVQGTDVKESDAEPNDAFYKDIGFQIKEIQTEGRKRDKEYKDKFKSINEETKPKELLEHYSPSHIPLSDVLHRVRDELERHRNEKYKNNTRNINALVYLNLDDTTYTNTPVDTSLIGSELGNWQSVSLVTNNCAVVLSYNDDSNKLLKPLIGKLYVKN